jgi:hypothetical protein
MLLYGLPCSGNHFEESANCQALLKPINPQQTARRIVNFIQCFEYRAPSKKYAYTPLRAATAQ